MCLGRESYGRTYAVVELSHLQDNIREVKSHLRKGMQFCAVVKMDAYGHGIVEVARAVEEECALFGVATIEEGIILRKGGITTPILILGVVPKGQYRSLWHYDIMPSLFTKEQGVALSAIAKKEGKSLACHLALDTGMGRIGIQVEHEGTVDLGLALFSLPGIEIAGIFSHFSSCDDKDKTYTEMQERRFASYLQALEERGIKLPLCHISNSAGILEGRGVQYDMVRDGIALYGLYPSKDMERRVPLKMALSWKAKISYIKEIPAGEAISYGASFVSKEAMRVATVPVGYGDGYPRVLSNKAKVLVGGKPCPILGRVCMDQFMIDVSQAEAEVFQEVTLLGKEGEAEISLYDWEAWGVFPYEFLCNLGNRVPRVYKMKGKWVGTYDPLSSLHIEEYQEEES